MLIQSIRDDDPVIFCEHKNLYGVETDVPAESYTIPFAEANVVREGKDVTIVSYGLTVHRALEAADNLAKDHIEAELIDLRTLSPLDWDTVVESVEHRSSDRGGRGQSALFDRQRHCGLCGPERLRRPQGRAADGDSTTYTCAVLPSARGPLHPSADAIAAAASRTIARALAAEVTSMLDQRIKPIVMPKWGSRCPKAR